MNAFFPAHPSAILHLAHPVLHIFGHCVEINMGFDIQRVDQRLISNHYHCLDDCMQIRLNVCTCTFLTATENEMADESAPNIIARDEYINENFHLF